MNRDRREAVVLAIAGVIVIVWAGATVAQIIDPSRQVPTTVNVVMPIVAAALFGKTALKRRNGGDGDA